jgi:hypothetical protein
VLNKDLPHGNFIETRLTTQSLKMLPGFPVPIPGIVVVTADPIYPAALDSDLLKIFDEDPPVNLG